MEDLAHFGAVGDEVGTRCRDIGDDQVEPTCRARGCRRNADAEMDGALRAGRRELDAPELLALDEIRVEPPTQAGVEALGTLRVGHWNADDLELHIDLRGSRGL